MDFSLLRSDVLAKRLTTTSWTELDSASADLLALRKSEYHNRIVESLAEAYTEVPKWQGRKVLVYHLIRYTREYSRAYEVAIRALDDRSTVVICEACVAIGASMRSDAADHLRRMVAHRNSGVREVAQYALDELSERKPRKWMY